MSEGVPFTFQKTLKLSLELDVEGKKEEILAGKIESVKIELHTYGYDANLSFVTFDDDKINALFAQEKVMKAKLTFKPSDPMKDGPPLFELRGIVYSRSYEPTGQGNQKKQIRRYGISFTDPAKITWSHHYPIRVFVDKTIKDVFDMEKNPLISIKYDWDLLTKTHPIIAYSLEFKYGLPRSKQVSFYSFFMWYLHQFNGIVLYDYKENSYTIMGKKTDQGTPVPIPEWFITPAKCHFPEPLRYQERAIKHSPESVDNTDTENVNGFQAVRREFFDEGTYRQFPEQVSQQTKSKQAAQKPSISFYLKDFNEKFSLQQLIPGQLIEIKEDEKLGAKWCGDPVFKDKTFRITDTSFEAKKMAPTQSVDQLVQSFELTIHVVAECKEEEYISRPEFSEPTYPFSLPGKIFSEAGDKEQTTYHIVKDDQSPLGQYQVKVPLVNEDKKVVVPFNPDFISGQHYFPLCKDQQVMLAFYFQTAKIERILDWQPLTRLPLDSQSNQIVFASNGKDKFVIQKHEYQGQDSIFIIKQSSSDQQTQTIQIKEKEIDFTVKENDKTTIAIQINRDTGLSLTLKDDASGVTQKTIYNAQAITHTSEGSDGKTTITQTPKAINMECKEYNIKCETASFVASKEMTLKGGSKISGNASLIELLEKVDMG